MKYNFYNIYMSEADYDAPAKEKKSETLLKINKLQDIIKEEFLKSISKLVKDKILILHNITNVIVRMEILESEENNIADFFRTLKTVAVIDQDYTKYYGKPPEKEPKLKETKTLKRFMK